MPWRVTLNVRSFLFPEVAALDQRLQEIWILSLLRLNESFLSESTRTRCNATDAMEHQQALLEIAETLRDLQIGLERLKQDRGGPRYRYRKGPIWDCPDGRGAHLRWPQGVLHWMGVTKYEPFNPILMFRKWGSYSVPRGRRAIAVWTFSCWVKRLGPLWCHSQPP